MVIKVQKVNSILFSTQENSDCYNSVAYKAYLQLFGVNSKKEREKLFNIIIREPKVSYLFINNFDANNSEKQMVLDSILRDPTSSYLFIKNRNVNNKDKKSLLNSISNDVNVIIKTILNCELSQDEKLFLFKKSQDYLYNCSNIEEYYKLCYVFKENLMPHHIEKLVFCAIQKIIIDNDYSYVNDLLDSDIEFPNELRDQLESILLVSSLKHEN